MSDATISMKLKPWTVPNFATVEIPPRPKQYGMQALPSIPISELPKATLDSLAAQWLVDLYKKAGLPLDEARIRSALE